MAISGDTIIVGESLYGADAGTNTPRTGAAVIFVRSGSSWAMQQRILAPDGANLDNFGYRVAIDGNTAVIAAPYTESPAMDQGSVYVYVRNGSSWTQQQKLTTTATGNSELLGFDAVGISGNTLIISKIKEVIGGHINQGALFVFVRNGGGWSQQQRLTDSNPNRTSFGRSAAISGDTIISSGAEDAYVFVRTGTNWTEQQRLTAPDVVSGDLFGSKVSLSGDLAIVGAPSDVIGSNNRQGSAYIFRRCDTTWTQQEKLLAADGSVNDSLGGAVGISGDTAIAAAQFDQFGSNISQGSAYIFQPVGVSLRPEVGQCDTSIVVNITSDEPDADLTDTLCDADLMMAGKQCSLRAAIQNANRQAGFDIITFNIPGGGVQTISPASPLPAITDKVNINGTSQPGYVSSPVVELRGDSAGAASNGLVFAQGSGGSKVSGITINRFSSAGIVFQSNDNTVEKSYIGLLADGVSTDLTGRQQVGVRITSSRNMVGGSRNGTPGNNLITGNQSDQIFISTPQAFENVISGNDVGLIKTGLRDGSGLVTETGIWIENGASRNKIGGTTDDESNLIDDFGVAGVDIGSDSNDNLVTHNAISACHLGIVISGASNNTIGGAVGNQTQSSRNIIGENVIGIYVGDDPDSARSSSNFEMKSSRQPANNRVENITAPTVTRTLDNKIQGNLIGLAANLTDFGNQTGIRVGKAERTLIGTGDYGFHNFISGNMFYGVWLDKDSIGAIVQHNYIGTDFDATTIRPNKDGVVISGSENQVVRNIISGNNDYGVSVLGDSGDPIPTGNIISDNKIGTKGTGEIAIPNDESGILLNGRQTTVTGNVVSGNTRYGIDVRNDQNTIRDNKIGTNTSGTAALANGEGGIFVVGSTNTISSNVISGNTGAGISVVRDSTVSPTPPASNVIQNNFIGTNAHGSAALPNSITGIVLADGANNNLIGGTVANTRNVISGNGAVGILIQIGVAAGAVAPYQNKIQGNYIGTNTAGTAGIPNVYEGIFIDGALSTLIGGFGADIPGARNIISGNGRDGIRVRATDTRISGNYIGAGVDGLTPLGNTAQGIHLSTRTGNTVIGGQESGAGNTIAYNGSNGILLDADAGNNNIIDPNRIFGNALHGIDIGEDGFTPNDPTDADIGPNKRQNYPTMTFAVNGGGDLIVNYQVDSAPQHSTYGAAGIFVEFFEADATGAGSDFLGSDHFLLSDYTNGTPGTRQKNLGNAAALGFASGDKMTATATDADGNSSEFTPSVSGAAASPVTVGGRVATPTGLGLRNAVVSMIDSLGVRRTATTSSFGVYSFTNVATGGNYTVTVASKRYRFTPRVMVISDNLSNLDFVGLE